ELDGMLCNGARRGKQFTYALLAERAPQPRVLARDDALAELAGRYFTSHGPATLKDFVWWSGLASPDARRGLEFVKPRLTEAMIEGRTYWFSPAPAPVVDLSPTAYLLPNYDEYLVGYADRSAVYDARHTETLGARAEILFHHTLVIDGQIAGAWKRSREARAVAIEATPFRVLNATELHALTAATERYGEFLGLRIHLRLAS
ncbi:MAG TPA: crosslink repair DNA glycosylase YcaQ family protein, partial [Chloroflexota bacterium]|nr:crosslink repair DNA glycosylase YcaQ family protein [Chloroflexota bacterium]